MSHLKQLISNIQTPSTEFIKIDKAFFADELQNFNYKSSSNHNITYIYAELGDKLTTLLISKGIHITSDTNILEIPKIPGPDFVISIKNIYDHSDKSKPLPELAKYIYDIINSELGSQNISLIYISHIEFKGIYINIYTSDSYKSAALYQISEQDKNYGNIYINGISDKNIICEFPSCNTAKAMGVHHVRAMVIGQVWNNILARAGAKICKWNYLGDRGTPFGKLVYSIQHHANQKPGNYEAMEPSTNIYTQIESHPNEYLGNIYADFKSIPNEDKEDTARSYFARLEAGDIAMVNLRKYIRQLSLQDFQNIFDKFGVDPDCNIGESYTQTMDLEVLNDLKSKELLHDSQGAKIVKFRRQDGQLSPIKIGEQEPENKDSMEIFILQKSDGSTNYATRDLGLMKLRGLGIDGKNKADKIYICTDNGQKLHFQLIGILAKELGYIYDDIFEHIPFGLLLSGGEKMSTRGGKLFRLEDMINEIKDKVKQDFADQNISDKNAEELSISAIIFNDIKGDINKDVNFDIKAITNLSGDSGIYLKGTMKRLIGLKDKIGDKPEYTSNLQDNLSNIYISDKAIGDIIIKLSYISEVFSDSINLRKPHIVMQYILGLCADFNSRYNNGPKILELPLENQKAYKYILDNIYICLRNLFETVQIKSE